MKKVLVVLAVLAGSVFLAQPAAAEDATTTETAAAEAAVEAPAEVEAEDPPPPPPAEADPPAEAEEPEPSAPTPEDTPPAGEDDATDAPPVEANKTAGVEAPKTLMVQTDDAVEVVAAAPGDKVWVCKYSGTPGVDEKFKPGKNPIEVDESATGGASVGEYFADGQGRSFVVQVGGSDPGVGACPSPVADTEVTTEAPILSAPTCSEDGALTLPTTTGVLYTITPAYAGPGEYDVDATALDGYVLSDASVLHWDFTVLEQLSGQVDCPIIVNPDAKKVWVCKYVGKPGVDEVLKGGKNPIEVSVNALPGSPEDPQVGDEFSDAQERSVVVALSPADPEPTAEDCPAPIVPQEVSAEAPIADPATCEEDGSLVLPVTVGITYTVVPDFMGPGDYVVTATVVDDSFELIGQSVFEVTVGGKLPSEDCLSPGGGDDPEVADDSLLPDTGGSPLELLLIAVALLAAGSMLVMRRSPATNGGTAAHSVILPTKEERSQSKKAFASAQPERILTKREGIVSAMAPIFRRQRN